MFIYCPGIIQCTPKSLNRVRQKTLIYQKTRLKNLENSQRKKSNFLEESEELFGSLPPKVEENAPLQPQNLNNLSISYCHPSPKRHSLLKKPQRKTVFDWLPSGRIIAAPSDPYDTCYYMIDLRNFYYLGDDSKKAKRIVNHFKDAYYTFRNTSEYLPSNEFEVPKREEKLKFKAGINQRPTLMIDLEKILVFSEFVFGPVQDKQGSSSKKNKRYEDQSVEEKQEEQKKLVIFDF